MPAVSSSPPESAAPTGESRPLADTLALELKLAADDVRAIERVLRHASDELARIKRRPLANLHCETAVDLAELVVARGQGFTALEVSVALRCTPTFVRRARLAAGVEPERGRAVRVNGHGLERGVGLVANGMSVRAAAAVVGVAKSTLHDHARQ